MRKILQMFAILAVVINPSGILPNALADTQTSVLVNLQLNTGSAQGVVNTTPKPDFERDFTIPAHRFLAERERARLEALSGQIKQMLAQAGYKTEFAANYLAAQEKTGTPWQLTAAVHKIESGQSGDREVTSYAGAQGPMQFMPGTWRAYAQDADGDGAASVTDADDAILTGARYLATNGANRGDFYNALFRYNHADWYVQKVLFQARALGLAA